MTNRCELNLRDLGGIDDVIPKGLFLRSGKLSILTPTESAELCKRYHIQCVIDLRTPVESAEFPDPLPKGVEYLQIPLLKDAAVGITHETGSDPMTIIRNLRKHPEKLMEMKNADKGITTLFHCTAGKDRTGIASMALLKSYGVGNEDIVRDYMRTNRNAFWPTIKKCLGVALLTRKWTLVKAAYRSFMADRKLIETAIENYESH